MRLKNQVAIVTGSGSGMGRAIALLYAQQGASVVVADINPEAANETCQHINSAGGLAIAVVANVSLEADIQKLVETAIQTYGGLDILVNNAGIMDNFVPAEHVTDELWERVLAINVTGPMRLIRKALPLFIAKGKGVIINVASIGGLFGSRAGAAYTASKHALIGLSKNVGFQYAPQGIRCNVIAPGGVNTNIGVGMTPDPFGMEQAMSGIKANRRMGEPDEIAKIALFLASDDSSLLNATVITADAGWTAY